jgi:hypothetical protein
MHQPSVSNQPSDNREIVEALRRCCEELQKIDRATHCGGTVKDAVDRGARVLARYDAGGTAS